MGLVGDVELQHLGLDRELAGGPTGGGQRPAERGEDHGGALLLGEPGTGEGDRRRRQDAGDQHRSVLQQHVASGGGSTTTIMPERSAGVRTRWVAVRGACAAGLGRGRRGTSGSRRVGRGGSRTAVAGEHGLRDGLQLGWRRRPPTRTAGRDQVREPEAAGASTPHSSISASAVEQAARAPAQLGAAGRWPLPCGPAPRRRPRRRGRA